MAKHSGEIFAKFLSHTKYMKKCMHTKITCMGRFHSLQYLNIFGSVHAKQWLANLVVELEDLQQVAGDEAGDADEEVDHNEEDVCRARLFKHKRRWIHHGSYGPAVTNIECKHNYNMDTYIVGTHI